MKKELLVFKEIEKVIRNISYHYSILRVLDNNASVERVSLNKYKDTVYYIYRKIFNLLSISSQEARFNIILPKDDKEDISIEYNGNIILILRGKEFIIKRITQEVGKVILGLLKEIELNMEERIDTLMNNELVLDKKLQEDILNNIIENTINE